MRTPGIRVCQEICVSGMVHMPARRAGGGASQWISRKYRTRRHLRSVGSGEGGLISSASVKRCSTAAASVGVTRDPAVADSSSSFSYAAGKPLNNIDPQGLNPIADFFSWVSNLLEGNPPPYLGILRISDQRVGKRGGRETWEYKKFIYQ